MSETTPTDETKNAAREALALTDAEIEALDVMGLFPTDYGMKKPVAWERDATARLSNVVARIKADAVAAALAPVESALYAVESAHHFHGDTCLCGFRSARARSRTEHITGVVRTALAESKGGERRG